MMCFTMKRNNEQQTVKTFTQHALSSFPPLSKSGKCRASQTLCYHSEIRFSQGVDK